MHHLPRFFSPREKTAAKTTTDPRKMTRKSRLLRRNAAKHFDYDAASTSSSLDDSSSSSSLVTRSLDLSDRTSFRIDGEEGELERIYLSLGLSGPDDFAIPEAAWEGRKIRSSSDLLPRSRLNRLCGPKKETLEKQSDAAAMVSDLSDRVSDSVRIRDEPELTGIKSTQSQAEATECSCPAADGTSGNVPAIVEGTVLSWGELSDSRAQPGECSSNVATPANGGGGRGVKEGSVSILSSCPAGSNSTGGIKGVRPPVLKPPPAMTLPVIDNTCSTWDILRDFAPKDDGGEEEQEREVERAIIKGEEGDIVLSEHESCSFSTSNDDDSSSTTTEPMSNISPGGMSNISPNGMFRRTITYWEKGDLLGRGSFGSVYEGISHDGIFFAVKEVSLLDQGSQGRQSIYQLEQEIALLSQFQHPNIVQYYGTDTDESKLYIFLELVAKGSLLRLYERYRLQDSQVSAYTRQILHGLKYLHNRNVVHRDIKCANLLVDASGAVKLADFGLAKATKLNDVKSCRGTAFWMAPEVVNNKNRGYGLPADIWSLGCTVLEMLTRQTPYAPLECMQALFRIGKGFPPPIPGGLSKDAQDFIMQCIQVNPSDRPSAAKLLDHPFVKRPLATSSGSASPYVGRR